MKKPPTDYKALARNIARVADIKKIFPISHVDLRKTPTDYQKRKLRKIANELLVESDPAFWERDFIPIKNAANKKTAQSELKQPSYLRGVFLPGGAEVNKISYAGRGANKRMMFTRGAYGYIPDYFDTTTIDIVHLEAQLKGKYANAPKGAYTVALQAGKWRMKHQVFADETELLTNYAKKIWEKYHVDFYNNVQRRDANGRSHGAQAHPSEWLKGIIWEVKTPRGNRGEKAD